MRIEDTTLPFLEEDCLQRFGRAEGAAVFSRTQERYRDLLEGADDRGSPAIREHLQKKLFPPMAYYLTLLERGIPREKALDLTGEETRPGGGRQAGADAAPRRAPLRLHPLPLRLQIVHEEELPRGGLGNRVGPLRRGGAPLQPRQVHLLGPHAAARLPGAVPALLRKRPRLLFGAAPENPF